MKDNMTSHDVDAWLGSQLRQHRRRAFMQECRVWFWATIYGVLVGTALAALCVAAWLTVVGL